MGETGISRGEIDQNFGVTKYMNPTVVPLHSTAIRIPINR